MPTQNSYDFNNGIRDVSEIFDILIANSPSFLKLLGSVGTSYEMSGVQTVTANKYEWVNETLSPYSSAISALGTDGDGTVFTLASNAGFEVGSIVRFESATGASKTELAQVSAVNANGTGITITRDYGSTTGVTLVVGDVMILNSTPRQEDSSVGAAILQQGVIDFNYTEIIDEVANLSATAMAIKTYDKASALAFQVQSAMVRWARKLESAAIYGVRVARTSSVQGTMGGILSYLRAAGGNIDATGGNISITLINNVIEDIYQKGGQLSQPVILCAPNQARRLSALNTSGSNPIVYKDNTDRSIGNYTTTFVGDLPVNGGAVMAQIFSAQNMIKDQIAVLDMSKINLRFMRGLVLKDATTPGNDGEKKRLIAEPTLEVMNGTSCHGLITGLNL